MITETKICTNNQWKTGYFLSIEQIVRLCRDFMIDSHDEWIRNGYVSNDEAYIESQLKKMED